MTKIITAGFLLMALSAVAATSTPEMPKMAEPEKAHQWLQQFAGEWNAEVQMTMDPSKPPVMSKGTQTARMVGGFWLVAEDRGSFMDKPFKGIMTLGYDPEKKKYVATWVDSMTSHLWNYEGTLDDSGKILTLETEGPCPLRPRKLTRFKDVVEIKSNDHRVFRTSVEGEDGKWTQPITINYRRKQ